jgi:hypothetical protein
MSITEQFDVPTKWDEAPRVNGFGIASLVLGTFAVAVAFIPVLGLPALVLGPLAIIFAGIGRARTPGDTVAGTAGLILGITGTLIALAVTILLAVSLTQFRGAIPNLPFNQSVASAVTGSGPAAQAPAASAAVPERECSSPKAPDGGNIQSVTFYAQGSMGKPLSIDYGSAFQLGCIDGVTDNWADTTPISDYAPAGMTVYSPQDPQQKVYCRIEVGGATVDEAQDVGVVGRNA